LPSAPIEHVIILRVFVAFFFGLHKTGGYYERVKEQHLLFSIESMLDIHPLGILRYFLLILKQITLIQCYLAHITVLLVALTAAK